jgi:hypothetical protein
MWSRNHGDLAYRKKIENTKGTTKVKYFNVHSIIEFTEKNGFREDKRNGDWVFVSPCKDRKFISVSVSLYRVLIFVDDVDGNPVFFRSVMEDEDPIEVIKEIMVRYGWREEEIK